MAASTWYGSTAIERVHSGSVSFEERVLPGKLVRDLSRAMLNQLPAPCCAASVRHLGLTPRGGVTMEVGPDVRQVWTALQSHSQPPSFAP